MLETLERFRVYLLVAAALLLVAAMGAALIQRNATAPVSFRSGTALPDGTPIRIHVAGEVERPGIYVLAEGERVIDAIELAGGAKFDGDANAINLARRLRDGEQIVVPPRGGSRSTIGAAASALAPGEKLNVNTASQAQLDQLPGIGEAYSRRIVDSRTVDGPFRTLEDLVTRKALPAATLEKIRDLLVVGP